LTTFIKQCVPARIVSLMSVVLLLSGCALTSVPEGLTPVSNFNLQRYLGTWYEIARYDHRFERGLRAVTANYTLNEDGTVKVVNAGISIETGELEEAIGTAKFVGSSDVGHLKVSFFGPIYGGYIVFALDQVGYRYALVAGPNRKYLWILSRTPTIDPDLYRVLVALARDKGFDPSKLIRVEH